MKKLLILVLLLVACSQPQLPQGEEIARGDLEYLAGLAIPVQYAGHAFIPVEGQFILVGYSLTALSAFSTDVLTQAPSEFVYSRNPITGHMTIIPVTGIEVNRLILNGDGSIPVGKTNVPKNISPEQAERILREGLGEPLEKLWGERVGEPLTKDHVIATPNGEKVVVTQHAINHALEQSGEIALKCFANKMVNGTLDLNSLTSQDDRSGLFHGLQNFAGMLMNGSKLIDFCGEGDWLYARISTCEIIEGTRVIVIKTIIRFTNNSKGRANLMRFVQNENQGVGQNVCR